LEYLGILSQILKKMRSLWLMIAYHDECQFAVHPFILSIKKYDSEEEAKVEQIEGFKCYWAWL